MDSVAVNIGWIAQRLRMMMAVTHAATMRRLTVTLEPALVRQLHVLARTTGRPDRELAHAYVEDFVLRGLPAHLDLHRLLLPNQQVAGSTMLTLLLEWSVHGTLAQQAAAHGVPLAVYGQELLRARVQEELRALQEMYF